ncbi:MAG: class I SAM-dependent methyltransferase [Coriobacteriia bacterium]|nr:class I SAM-dependent methyltransferase [Coriobacteriia bacterium]
MSDGPGVPTTEKVRGVFTRIARDYDRMNRVLSMGLDQGWRRRLVREAALTPGCEVLDVAAGTGDVAFAIARTGVPALVIATDFTPAMLDIARVRAASRPALVGGSTDVRFEHQDGQALTYEDGSFDVVTVSFGIRNMPDRAAGFREACRVLKAGGRYLILEFTAPRAVWFRPLFRFYLGVVVPLLGQLITGDRASYQYLNDSIMQFPTPEALAIELKDAGFSEVRWVPMLIGAVNLHVSTK